MKYILYVFLLCGYLGCNGFNEYIYWTIFLVVLLIFRKWWLSASAKYDKEVNEINQRVQQDRVKSEKELENMRERVMQRKVDLGISLFTKLCPKCKERIKSGATKCPYCTANI